MTAGTASRLGKYRLVAELARGGMGIVYLATSEGVGGFARVLVIKELKPELAADPTFLSMFLDEARLAARLHHNNIVQTNEVGNDGNRYFMSMEYLEGRTLQRVVRRGKELGDRSFTRGMYLRVICEILGALEYAHNLADYTGASLDIVHRDVNPQNVFVTYEGQVKVVDFGIAKTSDQTQETQAGVLKGKVSYMAPEQATGMYPDRRADLFSIGVMLAEAMTGERFWGKAKDIEILTRLVRNELPDPAQTNPDLPPELLRICRKAMAYDRTERYPSAAALLDDLEAYMEATGDKASLREIGKLVSERFASERTQMKNMVEEHMTAAKDSNRSVPALELPSASLASMSGLVGSSDNSISLSRATGAARSVTGRTLLAVSSTAPRPLPRRSPALLAGVGIVLGGALAGALALAFHPGGRPDDTADANVTAAGPAPTLLPRATSAASAQRAPGATAEPLASVAPAPTTVNVRIRVSPASARVSVDGTPVNGNPFIGTYARDSGDHQVRATAAGYLSKTETVSFDQDLSVDMSLERPPQVIYRRAPTPPLPSPIPGSRNP